MKRFTLSVLLVCLLAFNVNAAVVEDLYTIELEVADQTTSLRLQSFKQAFKDIVVKVSGSSAPLNDPAFKRPMRNTTRYVKQFRYQRQAAIEDIDEGQLLLKVEFSQKLIEGLLRGNGYPVWGKVRPSVLIVMSLQLNKRYQLVSEEEAPEFIEIMDQLSIKHGLPTQFPLLDLEDRAVLNYSNTALHDLEAVNDLSFRYQSDVVLVGDMIGISGKGWKGVWQSQFAGQLFKWEYQASTKEQVMAKAVANLARLLAQEYALGSVKEKQNTVIIHIADLKSLDEYLRISRYFSSLAVVEKTQVKNLSATGVSFYLDLRNSPEELLRLIELGNVIEQVDLPVIETGGELQQETLSFTYRLY